MLNKSSAVIDITHRSRIAMSDRVQVTENVHLSTGAAGKMADKSAQALFRLTGRLRRRFLGGVSPLGVERLSVVKSQPLRSVICIVFACLFILGLQGWCEWVARAERVREIETSLVNLAASLAQHAEDTIEVADTAVIGVVKQLETNGTSAEALSRLNRMLTDETPRLSRLRDVAVLGADGNWLATSMPVKGTNLADRVYFSRHRDDPNLGLFVSPPFKSGLTGKWVLTVSRRFQSADGSFGGVVIAIINLWYFVDHYATYDLGPNGAVLLMAIDGTLLARYPSEDETMAQNFSGGRVLRNLQGHSAGSYLITTLIDAVPRIVGYRRSDRYPVVVMAGVGEDQALGVWRSEMRVHMLIALVLTGAGGLLGLHLIRQRRRSQVAEMALRDSNARLCLVQEVGGIAYTDRTLPDLDALVSHEYAHIHGLPPDQTRASAAAFIARVHPDDRDRIAAITPASLTANGKMATEFRICRNDGSVRWISVRAEAFLGPVGLPHRIISAQQDITEIVTVREALAVRHDEMMRLSQHLTWARDEANRANRAKSHFLAGMSHELRTPLSGILGYAQLLHIEGGLSVTQCARVDAMLGAGKHLLQMITCVLDLSEIEAGHVELQAVAFDVQAVAEACLDLIRPSADAKGLSLSIAIAPGIRRELIADPMRLRQLLLNLLGNAAKFTNKGAIELRLQSSVDGSALRIEVADTGSGVPAEQRRRLFNEFERLDAEAHRAVEGAGLGLALSARFAALMGGRIGHDDNPGGGSVFWLELPLNIQATSVSATTLPSVDPGAQPVPTSVRALHVLVVDDVLMNRDIAGSFLRAAGHEVTYAENGAEAVAAVASTLYDVVLMDVRMPVMDGLEATRRIRVLEGVRGRVPIVALTAQAFTDQIAACRKAGMDNHLGKPFDMDSLIATVAQVVDAGLHQHMKHDPAPTTMSVGLTSPPVIGAELPILDPKVLDRTSAFLTPDAVASYLETIVAIGEVLLRGLGTPDALTSKDDALAKTAHKLAGSAGMFGFERVASLARCFERAVETGAADITVLADGLCMAIEASREAIHTRTANGVENGLLAARAA